MRESPRIHTNSFLIPQNRDKVTTTDATTNFSFSLFLHYLLFEASVLFYEQHVKNDICKQMTSEIICALIHS